MSKHTKEKRPMPNRDPNNWQWLVDAIPYLSLTLVTFVAGFVSVLHNGGAWPKALMAATLGTLYAVPLYPVFLWTAERYSLPDEAAFAACVFLAIMGVEWVRNKADGLYEVLLGFFRKWLK